MNSMPPMIAIPKEDADKMARLCLLSASTDAADRHSSLNERVALAGELAEQYMPLVRQLARAGLLLMFVNEGAVSPTSASRNGPYIMLDRQPRDAGD
jgi:hypothetical protein